MSNNSDTMFTLLDQNGPFASGDSAPNSRDLFSTAGRTFARTISENFQQTKYRIVRNQVFDLLNVRSFTAVDSLLSDKAKQTESTEIAYRLLGNMFGLTGNQSEYISKINSYSRTADSVIRYLKGKVLSGFSSHIEMTNEIDLITNPVDLLLIIFDDRYHKKARFEARRKLLLMNLAASIDQRERETDIEEKFGEFLDFLNRFVWNADSKIGELELVYIVSTHSDTDFSCRKWELMDAAEASSITLKKGQKLTLLKRRRFSIDGRIIPVYVSIRKKPPEAKVLKLLRKGEENPAVAVDDELGLMGVLDTLADVKAFQDHLTRSARAADSFMALEDISDSLTGRGRNKKNAGSSSSTQMLKFFARLGGMRAEFIVHTNESYLNYIYRRDVAHDEYEVKRIFDSGVAALLFPEDIYHLDLTMARDRQLAWFRSQLELC